MRKRRRGKYDEYKIVTPIFDKTGTDTARIGKNGQKHFRDVERANNNICGESGKLKLDDELVEMAFVCFFLYCCVDR